MANKKKVEKVFVLKDGATVGLAGGTSRVCRNGESFLPEELDENQVKRLRAGDPWSLDLFELRDVDAEEPAAAAEPTVEGQFDPNAHSAPDVVAHLREAPPAEIERIKTAEKAGKKRKTVLEFEPKGDGGAPLPSGPPVPEYDSLDEDQVLAVLRANESDDEFVARVKAYEAENQKRQVILDYNPTPPRQESGGPGGEDGTG